MKQGFFSTVRREICRLASRPIYLVGMLVVPLAMTFFFLEMLREGLPLKVPAGVVDMDHSTMSRGIVRSLNSMELVDVVAQPTDYNQAMDALQRGEILGFFVIPEGFEKDAVGGRAPQLSYYFDLSIYVPGSLMFKGFKTMGVTTAGALVQTNLTDMGAPNSLAGVVLQPFTVDSHPIHNPWLNYDYYLAPSFIFGTIQLMVFLMTVFSITQEIKTGSSSEWLATSRGRIGTALLGKLAPQFVIFGVLGIFINALLFRFNWFPMHGSELWMNIGMLLFIAASQSFAVIVCSVLPNPRLALSVCSLIGILSLSIAAFSFPVESMYGAIAIFAWILPVRWFYLIYVDLALDGWALYYSRFYFIYLLIFPILAALLAPLMKRMLRRPVYVP